VSGCVKKTASISGQVLHQGQPLTSGSVIIYCSNKQIVRGVIGAGGRYTVNNVPPGPAVVTIKTHASVPPAFQLKQKLPPSSNGPVPPVPDNSKLLTAIVIPERYGIPEESGLSVQVDRSQLVFDVDLQP